MNKKGSLIAITILLITILLVSCSTETVSPTPNPNLIYTAAAETAIARVTEIFKSTPSATATKPVSATPTTNPELAYTAAVQTVSATLTQAAALTPTTPVSATSAPAPTSSGADRAVYVADVTIPDGTVIAPGDAFVKTWKIQNAGTSTWSTSYTLVFISGEKMGDVASVPLTQPVAPGQQIDISVNLVAPTITGTYQGNWKMKNASGQLFDDAVYVLIAVGSGAATSTQPGSTQVATPTSTGAPSNLVSNLTMTVDGGTFTGACPHVFNFAANFTVNQGTSLTYGLEAFSETPGFTFDLPNPQTSTFNPETYSLSFPLELTSSGIGWVRFHITSPVDVVSNQASFNLTCNP
ncbi:MAG: NBR1-Ig-like domain-containing protein [Acidobacteriaceae bacterium]